MILNLLNPLLMTPRYHTILLPLIFAIRVCSAQPVQDSSVGLFESDEILTIQISGNMRALLKDRSDNSSYQSFQLSYTSSDSSRISIPIEIKTRGHFRKMSGNCTYPPLMLNFSKENTPTHSLFYQQDKIKLVTPCRGDKYVVREYLAYKLYNLISPKSFRAKLVKVIYEDPEKGKKSEPLYGILLEEEGRMAKRNNSITVEGKMLKPEQTQADDFLNMAVFQYLIGNTDWSVQYYQNIKLITTDSLSSPSTVPYDFDHAGIVEAPYANPAPELLLGSTRQRRYRGYCLSNLSSLDPTFATFNKLKAEIYDVFTKCPMLEPAYIKATVKFLDGFYETINNPKAIKREFGYPCQKDGTANVVIQGLKKN